MDHTSNGGAIGGAAGTPSIDGASGGGAPPDLYAYHYIIHTNLVMHQYEIIM
jgi:hypothetical protein